MVLLPPQPLEPMLPQLRFLQGLVIPGGPDLDPALYGESPLPELGAVSQERDALELGLIRWALHQGLPLLGICRGIQSLNVALGGSLYQDLPAQGFRELVHNGQPHLVEQVADSPLTALFPPRFEVNSYHHQAIKTLAPGLRVLAQAPDGVIEAVALEGHPFALAVQWHPELLPEQWGIFRAFVEAAERQPARV